MTSGAPWARPGGTYVTICSAPGLLPEGVSSVSRPPLSAIMVSWSRRKLARFSRVSPSPSIGPSKELRHDYGAVQHARQPTCSWGPSFSIELPLRGGLLERLECVAGGLDLAQAAKVDLCLEPVRVPE